MNTFITYRGEHDGIHHVVETFPDREPLDYYLNDMLLVEGVIKYRTQMRTLGEKAALKKWNREEARERKALGLKTKKSYQKARK